MGIGHWVLGMGNRILGINTFLYLLIYLLNYIVAFQRYLTDQIFSNKIARHCLIVYKNSETTFFQITEFLKI